MLLPDRRQSGGETASRPPPRAGRRAGISLLVESPSGERFQVSVDQNPFLLGRLDDCHVSLLDRRISRRHAQIVRRAGAYVVEDVGSRHGVHVNGAKVRRRELRIGDRIEFGVRHSYRVTVCEPAKAALLKKVTEPSVQRRRAGALGRLAAMLEVARTMEASHGVEAVLEAVVEAALTIARAERAFLLLRDESGALAVRAACGVRRAGGSGAALEVSLEDIAAALDNRADLFSVTLDLPGSGAARRGQGSQHGAERRFVCVPILRTRGGHDSETSVITARSDTLGALYMDSEAAGIRLAEGNRALLQALAIEVSAVVENARLIEQEREKRRLEQELGTARAIQQALLPPALPSGGWLVAKGLCQAQDHLGGDYYDLMRLDSGQWVAVVADVSGKGVAASLLASLLQGAFFLGSGAKVSVSGTLGRINRYICERSVQTRFATVFALAVSEDGAMRWSSAGHCPAIVVRAAGGVSLLESNSRPVGLFHDEEFAEDACQLEPGDRLVVYTDGVTELRNEDGEQFGQRRLERAVEELAGLGAADLFDALLAQCEAFAGGAPRADDLTLLAVGYCPPGAGVGGDSAAAT